MTPMCLRVRIPSEVMIRPVKLTRKTKRAAQSTSQKMPGTPVQNKKSIQIKKMYIPSKCVSIILTSSILLMKLLINDFQIMHLMTTCILKIELKSVQYPLNTSILKMFVQQSHQLF